MSSSDSEGTETDQDGYDTLEVTADGDTKTTHLNLEESSNGDSEDKEGGGSEKEGGSSKKNSARSDKGGGDLEGSAMLESDELSASDKSEKSKARRTKRTSELIADSPRTGDDEDTLTDPGSEMSEIGDKLPPGTEGVKKKVVRALVKTGKNLREIPGKKKIVAPYIIATMEGQKETMKCKVGNTLLPAWNSKLMFILGTEPTSENLLKFQVFDAKGQTKDELLGETTIEIMKLDWKKKRFEFKDHKLTHPKNDSVQGKLHFIILLSERSFAVETPPSNPKEEKKKLDAQKKQEEKMKKQEEKKKKEAEKGSLRRLKASESNNNGKGTLGKNSKPITEKHTIETKAGVAAPPDLLWNFISNFHDVEEWLPKMPCDILEAEEDGKLRRKIKYPDHEEGVIEKLEEKDDPNMTLKWSSTCKEGEKGLAGTVGYLVTLIIAPVGRTRSRLTWQVEYELPPTADDSEAKKFFEKLVEIGMDGLKVAAEG